MHKKIGKSDVKVIPPKSKIGLSIKKLSIENKNFTNELNVLESLINKNNTKIKEFEKYKNSIIRDETAVKNNFQNISEKLKKSRI